MNTRICPTCKAPIPADAPGGLCPACVLRDAQEPTSPGRTTPPLADVAAAFPQLEIQGLIGQGGMGFVYKARQSSLDRIVALKVLSPELGKDPAFAERFAREARVLGKLNHPNIVGVFEHGQSGPFFYLLMEFVDGVNLRQAMRAGRFTPQQALAVVPGICDALQAAHAQGVWHRDIKPENILLDARGNVKIADFGIARIVGDPSRDFTLTSTGAALGSAAYMAPEQHERPHDVDHRADIYSLGVVIYEMLTGELPLGRFPAPSQRAAVNARIDEIVLRTLEKERELRQQSADEVKTDVNRVAASAGSVAPSSRIESPAPVTIWSLGLMLAGVTMFAAAAAFTYGSTQGTLLTLAAVAIVIGFVGACVALFQMRHGQIGTGWRPSVRTAVWVPSIVVVVFGIVTPILWTVRSTNRALQAEQAARMAELYARARAEEVMKLNAAGREEVLRMDEAARVKQAIDRAAASPPAKPDVPMFPDGKEGGAEKVNDANVVPPGDEAVADENAPKAVEVSPNIPRSPGVPTGARGPFAMALPSFEPLPSIEETFRKLNAMANNPAGLDRVEFQNHVAKREHSGLNLSRTADEFKGTILKCGMSGSKTLLVQLEKSDGRKLWRIFQFQYGNDRWQFNIASRPQYQSVCRVEFKPPQGNALELLRTYSDATLNPVPNVEGQFDVTVNVGTDNPVNVPRYANEKAERLKTNLAKDNLGEYFKVVAPATAPDEPPAAQNDFAEGRANRMQGQGVFIMAGEVVKPGIYSVTVGRPFTVSMALKLAGGITADGNPNDVQLVRSNTSGTHHFSVEDVLEGAKNRFEPIVVNGDRITVASIANPSRVPGTGVRRPRPAEAPSVKPRVPQPANPTIEPQGPQPENRTAPEPGNPSIAVPQGPPLPQPPAESR